MDTVVRVLRRDLLAAEDLLGFSYIFVDTLGLPTSGWWVGFWLCFFFLSFLTDTLFVRWH